MKILAVDDHQLFLDGLRHTVMQLGKETDVISARSGAEALAQIDGGANVDLILLDMVMPAIDGEAFLQALAERCLLIPVVVVSAELDPRLMQRALSLGALGYIPKSHSADEMLAAIRTVMDGNMYLPPDVELALNRFERRRAVELGDDRDADCGGITRRQRDVLRLIAKGYSNRLIAATLHVSEHTVKSHVTALLQVLAATNRTQCVAKARRRGLLDEIAQSTG